jgi:4'-phosphopantetheinyl transferase
MRNNRIAVLDPTPMALDADEVHVWLARSDAPSLDDAMRERALATLSDEERAQQTRFHFAHDRDLYLAAHALVRATLSRYATVSPIAWSFVRNQHGCPSIAPGVCAAPLRFNLSHTRGLAACAVALDRDVGVDVEWSARPGETLELVDSVFAPAEIRAVRGLPADRQRARFFQYWTLKEAYIKARGMGLALPLEQFAFDVEGPARIRIAFAPALPDDPERWWFQHQRPTPEHDLALAASRRPGEALRVTVREAPAPR